MKDVFPAIERRFKGNLRLRRLVRRFYQGHDGDRLAKSVLPYAEVTGRLASHDNDTFDTDEPFYELTFNIYTKRSQVGKAAEIVDEMRQTFHKGNVSSAAFTTVIMREVDTRGPFLEDGTYKAEMDFTLHVTRKTANPVQELRAG